MMGDYDGDYVYMVPLGYKTREIYYENITTVPARIRGAYLTDEEKKDRVEFEILSPQGKPVYMNYSNQAIWDFNVTTPGIYSIVMYNRYVNGEIKVTFTMSTGQNQVLKKDDLSVTEGKLDILLSFIKRFNLEFRMNRKVHQERYKSKIDL